MRPLVPFLFAPVQSERLTGANSRVLPAIETVTREEIARLVQGELAKGLGDSLVASLPGELERFLNSRSFASVAFPSVRPALSPFYSRPQEEAHRGNVISQIDKAVREMISKTLIPTYREATSAMYGTLAKEIRADMIEYVFHSLPF